MKPEEEAKVEALSEAEEVETILMAEAEAEMDAAEIAKAAEVEAGKVKMRAKEDTMAEAEASLVKELMAGAEATLGMGTKNAIDK